MSQALEREKVTERTSLCHLHDGLNRVFGTQVAGGRLGIASLVAVYDNYPNLF